jgi:hypothetical protein
MRINEAVDWKAYFNPILGLNSKYNDGQNASTLEKIIDIEIGKAKLVKNYHWKWYLLKLYRYYLAKLLANDRAFMQKLSDADKKILDKLQDDKPFKDLTLSNAQRIKNTIQDLFSHSMGINYEPIQKYNPLGKTPDQVRKDLEKLEETYLEQIGDDDRFVEMQDGDKIIKKYPDGFLWMALGRGYCSDEASAMGHCGNRGGSSSDQILSLRKERKVGSETLYEPFATFIYDKYSKTLGERKGRANEKPVKKYHPYIMDLLKMDFIQGFGEEGYLPQNNFSMNDLTPEQRKEVIDANPKMAMYPGAPLKDFPDEFFPPFKRSSIMWGDPEKKVLYYPVELNEVVAKNILRYIEDIHVYMNIDSDDFIDDVLSELSDENMRILYDNLVLVYNETPQSEETPFIAFEEFGRQVSRSRFTSIIQDFEIEDEIDDFELSSIVYNSYSSAMEGEALKDLARQIFKTPLIINDKEIDAIGFIYDNTPDIVKFVGPDATIVYQFDEYFTDDQIYDAKVEEKIEDVSDNDVYPDKELINSMFSDYFPDKTPKPQTEAVNMNKSAEKWIKANAKSFKEKFGDNWETKLYQAAWKKFGKTKTITEHDDPSSYVDAWKEKGFDIEVTDYVPFNSRDKKGLQFNIKNRGLTTHIREPETGTYLLVGDKREFTSFDDAMNALILNTSKDQFVTEGTIMTDIMKLKELAGIPETEKKILTENATAMPQMKLYGEKSEMQTMIEKLNAIAMDDDEELNEASHDADLDENAPIKVSGVKGVNSKPFTKKFKNMAAYDKWCDTDEADDYEVETVENVNQKVSENENPCWDGYEMVGMKKKGKKSVPNCVPKE